MYEVFNYRSGNTIGYVETEADAWYVVNNDSRPLDFLHWAESESTSLTIEMGGAHPADDYETVTGSYCPLHDATYGQCGCN